MTYIHSLYFKQLHRRPVIWLAGTAALLYSSWPLGYILNPFVGRHDLASQLEALHEPYAWVFISMDVLTGVAILLAGLRQIKIHRRQLLLRWCIISYVVFGLLNAVAALSPLNCDPEAHDCGPLLHNPLLIIHGLTSILSPGFLCIGMLALIVSIYRRRMSRLIVWIFVPILLAWLLSGLGAAIEFRMHVDSNLLQYYFISVCSLSIALLIGTIEYLQFIDRAHATEQPMIIEGEQLY
jgi:Protein of unknown function (DUF998)